MAKYTINQLPNKSPVLTDEVELQATSGGLSGKATINDVKTLLFESPTFTTQATTPLLNVTASSVKIKCLRNNDATEANYIAGYNQDGNLSWAAGYLAGDNNLSLANAEANGNTAIASGSSGSVLLVINASEGARLDANGYLLVGYTSSNGAYKLQVNSQIFATNATVATSDARYKENVKDLSDGLSLINTLRPVSFEWKAQQDIVVNSDVVKKSIDSKGKEVFTKVKEPVVKREKHNFASGVHIGFIAQEVQTALAGKEYLDSIVKTNGRPEVKDDLGVVVAPKEEFLGLAESSLIAILVKAVQELSAKVTALEAKVK